MAKHTTYIFSEDARAQAEFYIQALGGEITSVTTYGEVPGAKEEELKDKVINLSLVAAGVTFLMSDSMFEALTPGNVLSLCLEFATEEEAHSAFNNLSKDGKVNQPLEPAFWGALFGQLEDKYGITWMITSDTSACRETQ
ncbi:VOC family protein [Paenibacillus chitinolyticus]|uniref:VOC family protein n=1 Tax=Paenibacillus TaxID=44249 RepID=UPI001C47F5A2|nr:VOC family protein [Paenibacillus chitinolyticus]MBV6715339.1 VOC family protein [Paenibacillus chitinolyticus]